MRFLVFFSVEKATAMNRLVPVCAFVLVLSALCFGFSLRNAHGEDSSSSSLDNGPQVGDILWTFDLPRGPGVGKLAGIVANEPSPPVMIRITFGPALNGGGCVGEEYSGEFSGYEAYAYFLPDPSGYCSRDDTTPIQEILYYVEHAPAGATPTWPKPDEPQYDPAKNLGPDCSN